MMELHTEVTYVDTFSAAREEYLKEGVQSKSINLRIFAREIRFMPRTLYDRNNVN